MIKKSFIILPKVGENTEKKLWANGINHWDDFLEKKDVPGFSCQQKAYCDEFLVKAKKNLEAKNGEFFHYNLVRKEHWRLFNEFSNDIGYVDIETTGLSKHRNKITTLSIYNGDTTKTFIHGIDMDEESVVKEMNKYKLIVTFNGTTFDLPFMKEKFPSLNMDVPHMDLRWVGNRVGLKGGLKRIERELDICRGDDVADVDGMMAVRLWKKWERTGNKEALDILVKYNQEDVINLKKLGQIMYDRLSKVV